VTVVEGTIGNCFPDVWETLPDANNRVDIPQCCHMEKSGTDKARQSTISVIPHLEMRACDWSKSRHMAVSKSH